MAQRTSYLNTVPDCRDRVRFAILAIIDGVFIVDPTRIRQIYEDFASGRLDRLSDVIDEKIDFLSHAPADVFPYLGRRRGRVEVLHALSQVHKMLEILSFWPITTVVNGDQAALTVVVHVKDRISDKTASFLAAHFLRFRDDRITDYCAIIDSLDAVRQLGEHSDR